MAKDKWIFEGPDTNLNYCETAKIVLSAKLKDVFECINKYFIDDSTENLHILRIAVRRFRYVMEIFYSCYDSKLFKKVYRYSKELQDLIGEGRDLDVLEIKVSGIEKEIRVKIPKYFYKKIENDKITVNQKIKLELIKFMNNKNVNKFILTQPEGAK